MSRGRAPRAASSSPAKRRCEDAITLGLRIAETAAHAARVLPHRTPRRAGSRLRLKLTVGAILIATLAMAIPVPMSALAPMEVAPRNAHVVAAPIDGVIDEILVPPNAMVKTGEPIARYVDTATRNQLHVAERDLAVAETRLRQLQQMAFVDDRPNAIWRRRVLRWASRGPSATLRAIPPRNP